MQASHKVYTAIAVSILSVIIAFVISAGVNAYDASINGGNYSHDANLNMPMLSEDRYTIDHTPFFLPNTSGTGACGIDINCVDGNATN